MINKENKKSIIKDLKQNFDKAQAVFLTNMIGIKSNDANDLRKKVREAGGHIVVGKNTLLHLGASGTE